MAKDITKQGISPITGLRYDPNMTPEQRAQVDADLAQVHQLANLRKRGINTSYNAPVGSMVESTPYEPGTPGFERGLSKYDRKGDTLTPVTSFDELNQHRYDEQPWWEVLGNGITKTVGRTATSFISSMVGSLAGVVQAGANYITGEKDWWKGFWDNPLSNAMSDIDDFFNENFVNYQSLTQQQNSRNGEWWKNMSGLNMWMDDVLTNTGFTLGMMAAAATGGGLLGLAGKAIKAAGIAGKYGANVAKGLAILNSTAGEAATEALGAKREHEQTESQRINDYFDQQVNADPQVQQLDASYQQALAQLDQQFGYHRNDPQYQQYKAQLDQYYQQQRGQLSAQYDQHRQQSLDQMKDEANHLGLAVGLGNMAILGISNFNLAGRFVDKAYRNAVKSTGSSWAAKNGPIKFKNAFGQSNVITKTAADGSKKYGSRTFAGNVGKRMASNMLSEGVYEEMGQGALSTGAKSYYAYEDIDNYWRARLDPDSVDRTADGSHDFLTAVGNGLKETYGSSDGWKEGFIGGITGMLFGASEIKDEWRNTRFAKRAARDLNNALADPKTTPLLRHFVAQSHHAANKDRLAEEGNQSDWKTEDDKAMFALVSTFRRAGKMDDLHEMIKQQSEEMRNMSDDDLNRLVSDSTRVTSAEQQRAQAKQSIQEETDKAISDLLIDGAELGDVKAAQEALLNAKHAEQQAVREARLAEDEYQKAKDSNSRRNNRRGRNRNGVFTNFNLNRLRDNSRRATAAQQRASRAARKAEQDLNNLFRDGNGIQDMEALLAEQERRNQEADKAQFTELYEGPFVDPDGNRMTAAQVRERLEHNLDKMHETIDQYQKTVEDINMQTRGLFDKEQEDYLAYASFLDKTHTTRAEGLVQKWRGILPESFRMEVPKGKAKKLAKVLGINPSSVQEDPDNEGMAIINTKDFTDEQYSAFLLDSYIGNRHMNKVDGEGNVIDDLTEKFRNELRDKALKAVEDEMERTGRRKDFNRDEFVRDMEDAGKAYAKANNFRDAFEKAMADPESILTSREKFIRNLKKSWARKKAKLMQKRMSVEQLGDLTDDQMKELDNYHFMLAKAEKMRRAVKRFWDSRMPSIYENIEEAFEDIADPELRQELINRMKQRVDEFVRQWREEHNGEVEDFEIDAEELRMHISLDDILPEGDPLWNRIDDKTKEQIKKGINRIRRFISRLPAMYKKAVNYWKKKYDNLRKPSSDSTDEDSDSNLLDKAADLLRKARLSEADKERLGKLLDAIRKRIGELSSRSFPGRDRIVSALKKAAKRLDDMLRKSNEAKTPDTEPVAHPPQGNPEAQQPASRAEQQASVQQGETGNDSVFQNPDAKDVEIQMKLAVREHTEMNDSSDLGSNIWQSVTGEYARRSNFTYKPYHEIVEEYLAQWDKELSDDEKANEKLHIMEFGPYSRDRSYSEWVRYAKRSRAVHDHLSQHNAFGYVDRGNIKSGDQINFRIFKTDDGELIVYLEHNGQVFADLNHPDYGANEVEGLKEIYEEFRREYEAAADKKNGVVSSLHTTAANVLSGFPKFLGSNLEGEIETKAIADFGEEADNVEFHIVGVSDNSDVRGRGKAGQPMVVLKRPGNGGLTRRLAVPIVTEGMAEGGIELQVMQAAALKFKDNLRAFAQFLKHFLKCHDVHAEVAQLTNEQGEMRPVLQVKITGDYVDTASRRRAAATLSFSTEDGSLAQGAQHLPAIRANVSAHLLGERQLPGVPIWEQVVKGTNLPGYKDFLKQVCRTNLADLNVHNSWVTLNKLVKNDSGEFVEQKDPVLEERVTFNQKGNPVVRVENMQDGTTYLVEFAQDEAVDPDDEDSSLMPIVVGVSGVRGKGQPIQLRITPMNQDKLLTVMAQAVIRKGGVSRSDFNFFKLDGITYKFYLSPGSSNTITRVDYADVQSDINSTAKLSDQLMNKPQIRAAFRHYNGTAKSMRSILKEWFVTGRNDIEPLLLAVFDDIANGRTATSLSPQQCITLLNGLDYGKRTAADRRKAIAQKLISRLKDKLAQKGVTIQTTTNLEKALLEDANNRLHAEGAEAVDDGSNRRYFISASGNVVYGFVQDHPDGSSTIYLDEDLLNPETVAHEYTHLWTSVYRQVDPAGWQKLVADIKRRVPDLWAKVSQRYGKAVRTKKTVNGAEVWVEDDDKIADEVFAHSTGKRAERLMNSDDRLPGAYDNNTLQTVFESLKKLINQMLSVVFGFGSHAKVMEALILEDMLSDDPLSHFDPHIVDISEEYGAKETPAEGGTTADGGTTAEQGPKAREGYVLMPLDAFDSPRTLRRKGYTIIGDQVEVPAGMSEAEYKSIGLKDGFIRSHISLDDDVESPLAANLLRLRRADPLFDGLHKHLPAMDKGLQRGWLSGNHFLLAAQLLLTEGQRSTLWDAARQELGGKVDSNVELAAQIGVLFNGWLDGTSSGNTAMDKVFGELRAAMENAVAESDAVLRAEDEMLRQDDSAIVPMPTDPLSNLSRAEQTAMQGMVLDHLSEADLEHLEAAGYSKHMFHRLTRESKERIRRCVL